MPENSKKIKVPFQVFELDGDGFHLLLDVEITGKSFVLVLDTGASTTVFDKTTVENLIGEEHILASEKLSTGLGITDMPSYMAVIDEVKLRGLTLHKQKVAILDLSGIIQTYAQLLIKPFLGVLGSDFFILYKAVIDFNKKTLFLSVD